MQRRARSGALMLRARVCVDSRWIDVGIAFQHENTGRVDLQLDVLPIGGKVFMFPMYEGERDDRGARGPDDEGTYQRPPPGDDLPF